MLPDPLHPAIVHFPVVLAFLLPIAALGALWAIRRGARARRAWGIPLAVSLALAASAWVSVETGEEQDERVEDVVAKQPLHAHEEMAETFLIVSGAVALIAAAGLVGGLTGRAARIATAAGSALLVVGAFRVGHSGGQLVYRYGAASAYAPDRVGAAAGDLSGRAARSSERERGEDDERR